MICDPWLAKLGPVGLARAGIADIRGFRRWRGRIWVRMAGNPLALPVDPLDEPVTLLPVNKPIMHWAAGAFQPPACHVDPMGHPLVTIEFDTLVRAADLQHADEYSWTPCGPCLEIGQPQVLHYHLNTR